MKTLSVLLMALVCVMSFDEWNAGTPEMRREAVERMWKEFKKAEPMCVRAEVGVVVIDDDLKVSIECLEKGREL